MAKKVTFDNLPVMMERALEILTAEGAGHTADSEILQRVKLLEKRFDNLERILAPDRPVVDKQTVLRVLKLRPKQLAELENKGALISHKEGRSVVFWEDDVIRFHAKHGWKAIVEAATVKSESAESEEIVEPVSTPVGDGLIDIEAAATMVGLAKQTIYKMSSQNKIPSVKQGRKLLFEVEALQKWMSDNAPRKGKGKAKKAAPSEVQGLVDIHGASKILDRTPAAIRQHLSSLPHEKIGNKLYFDPEKLREWAKDHPPLKRKSKRDENEPA